MNQTAKAAAKELRDMSDPKRARAALWYFKTGKGQYGEGDRFLGVTCGGMRKVAKEFSSLSFHELKKMLNSPFHEMRQTALFILVRQFEKGAQEERRDIYNFYIRNTERINNWDLVDCSAHKIVGAFLEDRNKAVLFKLARSKDLWKRRIAVIASFRFIKDGNSADSLRLAKILLRDKEDLIHKAVGWMLREVGKNCRPEIEENFLKKYASTMPRTMLRYAIENFPRSKRQAYLCLKSALK